MVNFQKGGCKQPSLNNRLLKKLNSSNISKLAQITEFLLVVSQMQLALNLLIICIIIRTTSVQYWYVKVVVNNPSSIIDCYKSLTLTLNLNPPLSQDLFSCMLDRGQLNQIIICKIIKTTSVKLRYVKGVVNNLPSIIDYHKSLISTIYLNLRRSQNFFVVASCIEIS